MNRAPQRETQRPLISVRTTSAAEPAGNWMQRLSERMLGMRRKAATASLILLSVSLVVFAILGHDGIAAYRQKRSRAAALNHQILSLQKENQRLALHDQRLQNDRDTIEYEAREQMHYTRPGEVIYTLPKAPGASPQKSSR